MPRRAAKPKKPQVRVLAWSQVAGLFPYGARMDMQPPAEVTVRLNAKSWTYTAAFIDDQGHRWVESVRIDPARKVILAHDITMKVSLVTAGRR